MNVSKLSLKWLSWLSISVLVASLAGCPGSGSSSTASSSPDPAPSVSSTAPTISEQGVPINSKVTATFSGMMDPTTLTATTFTVKGPGSTAVAGKVSYDVLSNTAIFVPSSNLASDITFTGSITTGAQSVTGTALVKGFSWTFKTGNTANLTTPTVAATSPVDTATSVPLNTKISATFSEAMDPRGISNTTFTVTGPGTTAVPGTVLYAATGDAAIFASNSELAADTVYTATISAGPRDLEGNALAADFVWTFKTGTASDTTAPTVSSTFPVNKATGVPLNSNITATFDKPMDATEINTNTFSLAGPNAASVAGTVSYSGTTAVFSPTHALKADDVYTATVATGVMDLAGNNLLKDAVWTFTMGSSIAKGPAPVVLGTAGTFVILAQSKVSTTGTTAIVGNVGISPAAESFLTGFGQHRDSGNTFSISSLVTGKLYASNMAPPTPANLTTAIGDMRIAYTDAAGRKLPDFTELGAGNISGKTLVPGLYKWGTGVLIASDVTLSGGANDVWIFQIAQNLTVSNGVKITLSGGAQAKNIFWQVAGMATLGTTADFKGIILCKTQIVLNTGAVMLGRAMAQTAVTLDANAVTQPSH